MLAIAELRQIALKMNRSGLQDIEIAGDHYRIHLRCDPTPPVTRSTSTTSPAAGTTGAALPIAATPPAEAMITAQRPGIIWFTHPLNDQVIAKPGATICAEDLIALLGIGQLLLPVYSPISGTVQRQCVTNGTVVEFGTELIALSPGQ